jgi:hypothetical protein
LLEDVNENGIDYFVGSGRLVFQHLAGIFIGLRVHIFHVLWCTGTNHVIGQDDRSSVQNLERLDQLDIRHIQVLPVIDEDSIHLANMVRVILEE